MKKPYTFRLETTLIKMLDQFDGTRTSNITNSIQQYCNPIANDNTKLIQLLESQISDLKLDKSQLQINNELLQKRIDYYMLPWYKKILLPSNKK
jgi:hypothetical protein